MGIINLQQLTEILKSVVPCRDYRSPRAFLECKFFNDRHDQAAHCVSRNESWTDISDSNVISELSRATMKHHLSSPRLIYAVTKLIIYQYGGVLNEIEREIERDLSRIGDEKKEILAERLQELQRRGEIPLICDYEIGVDNLPKAVVACALHCFYIKHVKLHPMGNAYAKGNVIALLDAGVTQKQFERDFPDYSFKLSWDELADTADCKYCHCERCKHKCAPFDSNYNVEQLLKLYLNANVQTKRRDFDDMDVKDALSVLDAITDALSSEAKSTLIKTLVRKDMSMSDQMKYAFDLMMQDKSNGENEN